MSLGSLGTVWAGRLSTVLLAVLVAVLGLASQAGAHNRALEKVRYVSPPTGDTPDPFDPTSQLLRLPIDVAVRTTDGLAAELKKPRGLRNTDFFVETTWVIKSGSSVVAVVEGSKRIEPPVEEIQLPAPNGHHHGHGSDQGHGSDHGHEHLLKYVRVAHELQWDGKRTKSPNIGQPVPDSAYSYSVRSLFIRVKETKKGVKIKEIDETEAVTSTLTVHRGTVTPPPTLTVTAPADGLFTQAASIGVAGTVSGAAPITVTVNGAPTPVASGTFSASVALVEGSNTVTVVATDSGGQTTTVTRVVTRDSVAPTLTVAAPSAGAFTTDDTPTIRLTYSDPSPSAGLLTTTLAITLDGQTITGSFTVGAVEATFTPTVPLAQGAHTLGASLVDGAGNQATTESSFTVDSRAPTVTLTPADGSLLTSSRPILRADYADPTPGSGLDVSTVVFELDGQAVTPGATVNATTATYQPPIALGQGSHTWSVRIRDNAGLQTTATAQFSVDTVPATLTLTPESGSLLSDASPVLHVDWDDPTPGSGVDLTSFRAFVNGAESTDSFLVTTAGATFTPTSDFVDGDHNWHIEVADRAGNVNQADATFQVDTRTPLLALVSPQPGTTVTTTTPLIQISLSDPAPSSGLNLATFQASANGSDVTTSFQVTATGAQLQLTPAQALGEGPVQVVASIRDNSGNTGTLQANFTIATPTQVTTGFLTGFVRDATTKDPIVGATVVVRGGVGATTTQSDGSYFLASTADTRVTLDIKASGFLAVQKVALPVAATELAVSDALLTPVDARVNMIGPAGGVASDSSGLYSLDFAPGTFAANTPVTVTPIQEVDALPYPFPDTVPFINQCVAIDAPVQPQQPYVLKFPNRMNLPAGMEIRVANYDENEQFWEDVGPSFVSADQTVLEAHLTTFSTKAASCASRPPPRSGPGGGPGGPDGPAGGPGGPGKGKRGDTSEEGYKSDDDPQKAKKTPGGSLTDDTSGCLMEEFSLPPVYSLGQPETLTFHYNSATANPEHTVAHFHDNDATKVLLPEKFKIDVSIEGIQASAYYAGFTGAGRFGFRFGGRSASGQLLKTGAYAVQYRAENYYTGTLAANATFGGPPTEDSGLALPRQQAMPVEVRDQLPIVNERGSAFGAGWSLNGLQRVHPTLAGDALITLGNGGSTLFSRARGQVSSATAAVTYPNLLSAQFPSDLYFVVDAQENIFFTNSLANQVEKVTPGGVRSVVADSLNGIDHPTALAIDRFGTMYVLCSTQGTGQVMRVTAAGQVSPLATLPQGQYKQIVVASTGDVYVSRQNAEFFLYRITPAGRVIPFTAQKETISFESKFQGLTIGPKDELYITRGNSFGGAIYRVEKNGSPTVYYQADSGDAGDAGGGLLVREPNMAVDARGSILCYPSPFRGTGEGIVELTPSHRLYATSSPDESFPTVLGHLQVSKNDTLFVSDGFTHSIYKFPRTDRWMAPFGSPSALASDASGWQRRESNGLRRTFDAAGLLRQVIDRNNNATTYEYDSEQRPTTITDSVGRVWTLQYGTPSVPPQPVDGKLTRIIDPAGRQVEFRYDADGNLIQYADPEGFATQFQYDGAHRLTGSTNRRGYTSQITYSGHGIVQSMRSKNGAVTTIHPIHGKALINDLVAPVGTSASPSPVTTPGQLFAEVIDALGGHKLMGTNGNHQMTHLVDPMGGVWKFDRDAQGNPVKATRPDGSFVSVTYSATGRPTAIEDTSLAQLGQSPPTTRFTHDGFGELLTATSPRGHTTVFLRDARGNQTAIINARGFRTDTPRTAAGLVSSLRLAGGSTWAYSYDLLGNLVQETDPAGHVTVYERDTAGQVTAVVGPRSGRTAYAYSPNGRVTQVTNTLGFSRSFGYDPEGNATSATDEEGRAYAFAYNPMDRLLETTLPSGRRESVEYDLVGRQTALVDALSRRTTIQYNAASLISSETSPTGATHQYGYTSMGFLRQITDPVGNVTNLEHDVAGRLTAVTDGAGVRTQYGLDADGNVATISLPGFTQIALSVDPEGRTTGVGAGFGSKYALTFDGNGWLTRQTDPTARTVDYGRDVRGSLTSITRAAGTIASATTQYEYDADYNLTSVTTPQSARWEFGRDLEGQLRSRTDPLGRSALIDYDRVGDIQSKTNARGQTVQYERDQDGRLTRIVSPGGIAETLTYDAADNVVQRSGGGVTVAQTFDDDDRLTGHSVTPLGKSATFQYDAAARQTGRVVDGQSSTLTFNGADQPTSLAHPSGANVGFEYTTNGQVAKRTLPGGVQDQWDYDFQLRLQFRTVQGPFGSAFSEMFQFDAAYRPTSYSSGFSDPLQLAYDPAGRLTSRRGFGQAGETLVYDSASNLTRQIIKDNSGTTTRDIAYTVNVLDQVTSDSTGAQYTYDADGQLSQIQRPGELTELTWDARGRLTRVTKNGTDVTDLTYYPVSNLRYALTRTGAEDKRYLWDPTTQNLLAEIDAGTNAVTEYLSGYGLDELFGRIENGVVLTLVQDVYGSVVRILDSAAQVLNSYAYTAYGQRTTIAATVPNALGFAGRELDPTGFAYHRARYYSPDLQRWISPEPLGFNADSNHYSYGNGSPSAFQDRNGQFAFLIPAVVGFLEFAAASGVVGGTVSVGVATAQSLYANGSVPPWATAWDAFSSGFQSAALEAPLAYSGLGPAAQIGGGAALDALSQMSGSGCWDASIFAQQFAANAASRAAQYGAMKAAGALLSRLRGSLASVGGGSGKVPKGPRGGNPRPPSNSGSKGSPSDRRDLNSQNKDLKYHYTSAPESSFEGGLWRETSVTDNPNLTAAEAIDTLGLNASPDKVIPIIDDGHFKPNDPPIVLESQGRSGGGTDFINKERVPAGDILPAMPIRRR